MFPQAVAIVKLLWPFIREFFFGKQHFRSYMRRHVAVTMIFTSAVGLFIVWAYMYEQAHLSTEQLKNAKQQIALLQTELSKKPLVIRERDSIVIPCKQSPSPSPAPTPKPHPRPAVIIPNNQHDVVHELQKIYGE